jgi:hypothetical protein
VLPEERLQVFTIDKPVFPIVNAVESQFNVKSLRARDLLFQVLNSSVELNFLFKETGECALNIVIQ